MGQSEKKKIVIILVSIFLLICLTVTLVKYLGGCWLTLYINEGVLLTKPLNEDIIYSYEFREGEDFYIFNYDKDNDIKKIIKRNHFKKITKNNLEKITKVLNRYRDDLCEKELGLFDKTTNVSDLAKIGNYYLYQENIKDDEDYSIQIIFPEQKKVYHFNINH